LKSTVAESMLTIVPRAVHVCASSYQ
jgi:hypothetical protein